MSTIAVAKRLVDYQSSRERLHNGLLGCLNCEHHRMELQGLVCKTNGFFVGEMAICKNHSPKALPAGDSL